MADQQKSFTDPQKYRELCKPFASTDEANAALTAFADDLYELRCKHKLRDVYCVIQVDVLYQDGEEGETGIMVHYGDQLKREGIAAYAHGYESAQRQQRVAEMMELPMKAIKTLRSRK